MFGPESKYMGNPLGHKYILSAYVDPMGLEVLEELVGWNQG